MKSTGKIVLGMALLATGMSAYAQEKKGYKLTGELKDTKLKVVYLTRNGGGDTPIVDSAKVVNGKFVFKGVLPSAEFVGVKKSKNGYDGVWFFLDNNSVQLKASNDSLHKAVITGSPTQDAYKEWDDQWENLRQEALKFYQLSDAAEKMSNKDSALIVRKTVEEGFANLDKRLEDLIALAVSKYPNSVSSAFIIKSRYIDYPYPDLAKKYYAKLGEAARKSVYGKQIGEVMSKMEKTDIGKKPVMSLPDAQGKMVSLSDFKGKYVLVDFWASWCGPCRKENPNVVSAYKTYHQKGFEILGVSLDDNKEKWLAAVAADGLTWTHVSDLKAWKGKYVEEFGIKGVPTSFILDREGKIVAKDLRGEELHKKLAELLGDPK